MRKLNVAKLVPGMITAEDVYTFSGKLIAQKGTVLNDNAITKFEFYSVLLVKVEDELAEGYEDPAAVETVAKEVYKSLSHSERIKQSEDFKQFKATFDKVAVRFKELLDATAMRNDLFLQNALEEVPNELIAMDKSGNIFDMLHNMREYDDMTYVHCINVALMCSVFARWLKLSDEDVKRATLAGLLHDTGKVAIPDVIIKKPGKLTEQEFAMVKRHTIEGYNALRRHNAPDYISNVALMHHERADGSGYPLGLHNEQISYFARMVSIVDVYDAMTSARVYRGPQCPFKVVAIFEEEGLRKYDIKLITTFLENIVNTYLGQRVLLSDGRTGDIVFINRQALSRPTVQVDSLFVNLSEPVNKDIYVEAII